MWVPSTLTPESPQIAASGFSSRAVPRTGAAFPFGARASVSVFGTAKQRACHGWVQPQ